MDKRQFRVQLKNGNEPLKYFDSPKDAKKIYGSDILKYVEIVTCDENPTPKKRRDNTAVVMVSKTNNEILLSETQGYRATPNRPNEKKIHKGMIYLEIGESIVLESRFIGYEKYDEILHHQWRGVVPPNKKTWKYVVKHEKSKIMTMEEGIEKYGKIKKTQSGIIYLPL